MPNNDTEAVMVFKGNVVIFRYDSNLILIFHLENCFSDSD